MRAVICSDSAAAMKSLNAKETCREDLLLEVHLSLLRIQRAGLVVEFCWIPAHVGLMGNERVDKIAKSALTLSEKELINTPVGRGEAKSLIITSIKGTWQKIWDTGRKGRHLYNIQQSINREEVKGKCRNEEVVYSRLRLGHTRLRATLYIIGKVDSDKCEVCGVSENVQHVLMECYKYRAQRAILRDKLYNIGRGWNLQGILGKGDSDKDCR